jgi:hypothetical protein
MCLKEFITLSLGATSMCFLSTPFWEFRAKRRRDSKNVHSAPCFLLHFGSFPGFPLVLAVHQEGRKAFLLPFGSFDILSSYDLLGVAYNLSTPFWEFQ